MTAIKDDVDFPPIVSANEAQKMLSAFERRPRGLAWEVQARIVKLVFEAILKWDSEVKITIPAAHRSADMRGCAIAFKKELSEAGYTSIFVEEWSEDHDRYVDMWLTVNFSLIPSRRRKWGRIKKID